MSKPFYKTCSRFWQDWCSRSRWGRCNGAGSHRPACVEHGYSTRWQHNLFAVIANFGTDDGGFLLPSLVLGMTSFTRIIIVLSILRQAMGTQQTPPNQVLIAIALFLSLFIMTPTLTAVYDEAVTPMSTRKLPQKRL